MSSNNNNNNTTHLERAIAALAQRNATGSLEGTTPTAAVPVSRAVSPAHSDTSDTSVTTAHIAQGTRVSIAFDGDQRSIITRDNGDILLTDDERGTMVIPRELATPAVRNALETARTMGQARRFAEAHLALAGVTDLIDPNTLPIVRETIIREPAPIAPGTTLDTAINVDETEEDPLTIYETREEAIIKEKANGEHREIRSLRDVSIRPPQHSNPL